MLGKTMLPGDEELGKKDDDHRFAPAQPSAWSTGSHRPSSWSLWNYTSRWRRRRVLLVVALLFLVYLFYPSNAKDFKELTDGRRYPPGRPIVPSTTYERASSAYDDNEPTGPPPGIRVSKHEEAVPHIYGDQIRFYRLASTLRPSASRTDGYHAWNRNVLFAVSSLQSASTLLPMVCEMSKWSRNHVHAVFMGREDIPLDSLLEINGIDVAKCPAIWHDARPDYTEYSTDARAESAVIGAMMHIHTFLHPQAVVMDDSLSEDDFFVRGIRNKTQVLDIPLIEVPRDRSDDFTWITRLDTGSLRHWHAPTVDIMIQVPPESSSVLRLLKSLKDADYAGLKPPRITLELPAELDESVKDYLENFQWPPHNNNPIAGSGFTVRRRITNHRATQEDAAVRFLELFYPTSTSNSHVLLLSPQAQLSPQYFHFIRYALLEYKYSTFGEEDNRNLMGVSLELPSVLFDGKSALVPPTVSDMHTDRYKKLYPDTKSAPFLWQAPNSHATLFFGNKWAELHSFLSSRVVKHQESSKSTPRAKLISETLPAWTEYMLEFMRARGYSLLYPAATSNAFVTIHNELYHAPEEFHKSTPGKDKEPSTVRPELNEPFLRADEPPRPPKNPEPPVIPGSLPLHMALPFNGDLPEVPHLPQVLYDGKIIALANVSTIATEYADQFREEVGGCTIPKGKHRKIILGEARDLFCFGDEDTDDWEDDVPEESDVFDAHADDDDDDGEKILVDRLSTATPTRRKPRTRPTVEADDF